MGVVLLNPVRYNRVERKEMNAVSHGRPLKFMARGLLLSAQTTTCTNPTFIFIRRQPLPICKIPFMARHPRRRIHPALCHSVPSPRFFCNFAAITHDTVDTTKYTEAFYRRMAMAGLKPHHRIAMGVSGGPDSMALCALTAQWKTNGLNAAHGSGEFIDGLLAIIVDHRLRAESEEEANTVSLRVSEMGIRCEIAHCDWLDGRPKQGHLQEAAREMRYQSFQKVCIQNQIGVLLIAHHADDQAELFVLRLSRNSGVLGLAGMPFASQIFSSYTHSYDDVSNNCGILLVRPLLDFSKEDLYKICQGGHQEWVEDPTNQSLLYARNRIRMSLRDSSTYRFKYELQAIISACRKTRLYVDHVCSNLISNAVTIMDLGYAVIDLEILNQSKIDNLCLSRFTALVLQFISQRHRPIRGSTAKLLLEYMHTFPCKTSLTAAGCYLCPAPGSRGTKALVCCSVNCPLPSTMELFNPHPYTKPEHHILDDIEQILADGKLYLSHLVPDVSDVHFLGVASESVLTEAKRLGMVSESTYNEILLLHSEEIKQFRSKTKAAIEFEPKQEVKSVNTNISSPLLPGQICSFMNRFFVVWKPSEEITDGAKSEEANCEEDLEGESWRCHCRSCIVGNSMVAQLRHMNESDWLYLAELSKCSTPRNFQQQSGLSCTRLEQTTDKTILCLEYARLSAQRALRSLKSIPVAARRSLPVLANSQGHLLSIPNVGFKHCPYLKVSVAFKPRVPLGGGHSSFI
ncbi:hypothetical protein FNV43_RR15846 [Rhamnella rubrinervis]|uniref:tRNA(Ile)-lysidine synthetase n=1 Tax=Rhamnella rubrinervis TaxID=2594499 RepID=A0A8K0E863_9ROSA|nr:hypothetical protein FNV43_RR15846 [Rhamnella rubrinervis]